MSRELQKGKRVHIRYPEPGDRDEFLDLRKASRTFHRKWEPTPPKDIDPYGSAAYTRFQMTSRLERCQRFVVCRNDDGAIVGATELSEIVRGCFQNAYMGYWIGKPFARSGLGSEGVHLTLRHAFGVLRLHRVEANIQPTNDASLALAKRVGLRYEGYSPRYLKMAGRWCDHERWAILREEWDKLKSKKK